MSRVLPAVLFVFAACANAPDTIADGAADPTLLRDVQQVAAELGPNVRAAVWLSRAGEPPLLAWNVEAPLPCASSIKAAYLVELFGARAEALDEPLPGCDGVLGDAQHPAVAHFSAAQRATARAELAQASVRRIGEAMISGKGVDNATYNLAANLVTAFFGGPLWLEQKLHERNPEWGGLHVRRYMLADRTANGDNEVTARSLAAVHTRLAQRDVPGLSDETIDAIRTVLERADDAAGRRVFAKGGSLDSEPVTRVRAGFREGRDGAVVHVVVLVQSGLPAAERSAAGQRLARAATRIEQLLLE